MDYLVEAIRKIEAQQSKEPSTIWCVGEQLKDLLRTEPGLAELVSQDLDNKSMSLAECEKKIRARADEIHKTERGSSVCVSPREAEGIIRKFYGLPERGTAPQTAGTGVRGEVIDLADFF